MLEILRRLTVHRPPRPARACPRGCEHPLGRPGGPVAALSVWHRGAATGVAALERLCPACWDRHGSGELADPAQRVRIGSPEDAAELLVPALLDRDRERCLALLLDTKHRLLASVTVSVGSLDRTFMAPREVYRDALLANAAAVVLGHNHPSGDPEPSRDDEQVTRRLARAGELLGVDLLDHLVVGGRRWVSLARRGQLAA